MSSTSQYLDLFQSFAIEFEIQRTACTMDCNEPALKAFEISYCTVIQPKELGQNAALLPNLHQNASDPQSVEAFSWQYS